MSLESGTFSGMEPRCARAGSDCSKTSNPAIVARPEVGGMKLAKIRIVVVLPAPFGPSNPMISPRLTSKFKSRMAGCPAYRFVRFSTLIISQYFHETTEPRLRCRFFLTRRHAQSGELPGLSAGPDYANGE